MIRALALLALATLQSDQRTEWNRPQTPFRIAGNLYYVGTSELAAYLVTDPNGHVLIDGALSESVPQIRANIEALGFRPRDVKRLLVNHAHWDHADGLAALKAATGAPLWASAADRRTLETGRAIDRDDLPPFAPVKVDRVLKDGEVVSVGATRITTLATPGHTPGCTSFTTTVRDPAIGRGRPLKVLLACSLTVADQQLVGSRRYPNAAADFRRSFARLAPMRPDIFVNFHASGFDLAAKRARQAGGDAAAFVDPGEWPRRLAATKAAFEKELARQTAKGGV
ncbi:subclass B3 metallo-beta-lactamase [Sphingomonas spermidinifaciens]|uniref:Subclass B3 metallo-beta-lactamase n=1 Tax=Sphingomonas spermidinifaciens TaxID=1141889 RepID=A0A2A4B4I0_9SPHN|nr:subclass B3 metallo-beta-lactamase [Sphingomonas spermidinifaciens]PCD02980.1 subclass B3 metallo-beta-lactamase [Sphingomonas spermidinifaciens]